MTSETSTTSLAPARRRAVLSRELRRERCEAARWALASGRPLNLDAVTVILAVRSFESVGEGKPFHRWTTHDITSFVWGSAVGWCGANGIEVPADLAESMWSYLAFVGATDRLVSGSSPPGDLLDALGEAAGLTRAGRRSRSRRAQPAAEVRILRHDPEPAS